MKSISFHPSSILFAVLLARPVCGQAPPVPHFANAANDVHFATPPHFAHFTPPAPKAPLPPAQVIDRKQSRLPDGGTLTIEQIVPPSITPAPAQPQHPQPDPTTIAQFRAARAAWNKAHPRVFLDFSATIYDHQYTHLRWQYHHQQYQAWSNIDFSLLSGPGAFLLGNTTCDFHFIPQNVSSKPAARPGTRPDGKPWPAPVIPAIPELPAAPAFLVTEGDDSDTEALAGIQALHDLWLKEHDALIQFQQEREQCQKEREAWHKTHPPVPEDITVRFAPSPGTIPITKGGVLP